MVIEVYSVMLSSANNPATGPVNDIGLKGISVTTTGPFSPFFSLFVFEQ
jgi:hypothetical protein